MIDNTSFCFDNGSPAVGVPTREDLTPNSKPNPRPLGCSMHSQGVKQMLLYCRSLFAILKVSGLLPELPSSERSGNFLHLTLC